MKFLAYFRSLAAKFFRRSQVEDDMEEELRSHIEHRADDLARSGLDRAEAERHARIEFGGQGRFKEECREALGGNFIETLMQDARFSLRVLRKSPGFDHRRHFDAGVGDRCKCGGFWRNERSNPAPAECASVGEPLGD